MIHRFVFALSVLSGLFVAASSLSAHCGSCGVGDAPADAEHACAAECEGECCLETGHPLVGEVVDMIPDRRMLVVKHEKIEGVMNAMTMGFAVPKSFDLATLEKGDRITARMLRDGDGYLIKFIAVVEPEA